MTCFTWICNNLARSITLITISRYMHKSLCKLNESCTIADRAFTGFCPRFRFTAIASFTHILLIIRNLNLFPIYCIQKIYCDRINCILTLLCLSSLSTCSISCTTPEHILKSPKNIIAKASRTKSTCSLCTSLCSLLSEFIESRKWISTTSFI